MHLSTERNSEFIPQVRQNIVIESFRVIGCILLILRNNLIEKIKNLFEWVVKCEYCFKIEIGLNWKKKKKVETLLCLIPGPRAGGLI